jgi:putative oxidoreductase
MFKHLFFGGAGGGSRLADLGLLVLRAYTGVVFVIMHGWPKFQNPSQIMHGTEAMGFPAPKLFGGMAIFAELVGGALLALGLATRPAAFLIASTMIVAGFKAHGGSLKEGELAFTYLAVALCLMLTGAGRYGIDTFLRRRGGRKKIAVDRG